LVTITVGGVKLNVIVEDVELIRVKPVGAAGADVVMTGGEE
jgi:hypothetical protein